jgi:two-component system invasion response regulator UvrY
LKSTKRYKVIIADDHQVVRTGVKLVISNKENIEVVGEASSYTELLDLLHENRPDILVLDLNLGDNNGIKTIREISERYKEISILVLSMFPEDPYALQSIQSGAKAYVSKNSIADELLSAIDSIVQQKVYLNPEYLDTLPYGTEFSKTAKSSIESLSRREYEVCALMVAGIKPKEIAEKLDISPKTVSTYRTRILSKLSLDNTNQLIQFAIQNNFITDHNYM